MSSYRALHAHELALKTLHMDIDTFKTMGEQQKTSSKPLWKAICLFLCEFVKNNDTNISLVALSFSTGNCGIGSGFYGSDSIVLVCIAVWLYGSACCANGGFDVDTALWCDVYFSPKGLRSHASPEVVF